MKNKQLVDALAKRLGVEGAGKKLSAKGGLEAAILIGILRSVRFRNSMST